MKTFILTFVFTIINLIAQCQNLESIEWNCDTMTTQTEMNICSYQTMLKADSLIKQKYASFISVLKTNIESSSNFKGKRESKNDLRKVQKSQLEFEKYLIKTLNTIRCEKDCGTIYPLLINSLKYNLIVSRIQILDEIRSDLLGDFE